jgi:putative flavoprotein involved in K+ transport
MSAAIEFPQSFEAEASLERFDVIVIGGGQAGLSVGYYLAKQGLSFVILDAHERIGDAWRKRWDSLRLFSPARFDALDGLPFPAPPDSFPTRDEMAAYLELYAKHFSLPVRGGERVESLSEREGRFVVRAGGVELIAEQVVVAMSSYQQPRMPSFAAELGADVTQLHSSQYRNQQQLREGPVLVAGAGNSGAEIAYELARAGREVWLAGRDVGQAPFAIAGFWGRLLLVRLLFRVLFHRVLTIGTPLGRKARPQILRGGTPLIRTRARDLAAAGVRRVGKIVAVEQGRPRLDDGRRLEPANVIWCTGYDPAFSWIELPIFDERGEPRHQGGVVPSQPGLYFVGLSFLYAMSSGMIHGVGRDAERITRELAKRRRTR